jgi:hypothetical protein
MLRSVVAKITPCRMLNVPKVRISGWMRSRFSSQPFAAPIAPPMPAASSSAGTVRSEWPSISAQISTTVRPSNWPTERSIRPPTITKVWPIATRPSAAAWVSTLPRLSIVRNAGTVAAAPTTDASSSAWIAGRPNAFAADATRRAGISRVRRSLRRSVMTQPNFEAKFFNVAACRSGANDDTASDTIVVG